MRSKYLVGLLVSSGLAILGVAGATGCGPEATTPGTGGAGGSDTSSSSTATSSTTGVGSGTGGTGGVAEPPNNSCDEALANDITVIIDDLAPADTTLEPIEKDEDYFILRTGDGSNPKAGAVLNLVSDAKPTADEFDPTYPDLVLTAYKKEGGKWVQFAQNDDPFPRSTNDSSVDTILPASENDEYCVRITECNVAFGGGCAPASDIVIYDYAVGAGVIDPSLKSIAAEAAEPNDMPAMASLVEYEKNMQGKYYLSLQWGAYASAADVDVWKFNLPADAVAADPKGRTVCNFDFLPSGVDGNGSSATAGVIAYVTTAADPMVKLAEADIMAAAEPAAISFPCTAGEDYLLFMTRAAAAVAGKDDFYFMYHNGSGSNPLEAESLPAAPPDTNNLPAMPEALTPVPNGTTTSYFVEGDINKAGDVDYFSVDVPAGSATISVACSGQRFGTAVRGLSASIFKADGTSPIASGTGTETAAADIFLQQKPIAGNTKLVIKMSAASLDPNIKSTGYRCGYHIAP